MMISLSQAYVLRKIWKIETNNRSHLKHLARSWTFNLFIKNNLRIFLQEQGIIRLSKLSNLGEKNWKRWITHFNRYNLSPKIWYGIAPHKWRSKVGQHWKKNKVFGTEEENLIISEQTDNSYTFCMNSLMGGTRKNNKLFKNTLLIHKFSDLKKNLITKKFSQAGEKSLNKNISKNDIDKDSLLFNKQRIFSNFSRNEKKIFFEYNILLWFVPEFLEHKDRYRYKKILNLHSPIVRHKNFKVFKNKDLLRDRELNQSIRQWRWKSRNYEKRFEKLGNMASLMTFMQNQETMISLSGKMRKDLDLFRLFFRRNNNFNRLSISSEHRLPRLLDDQVLIYKLISTSLNFKQRLKKISNLEGIDKYASNTNIYGIDRKRKILIDSLNLEDILLPKRRREFRILNSLARPDGKNIELTENVLKKVQERNRKIGANRNKIMKCFIWSSYRFEDLACMNRFWFSTMNGSRFSILRFRMYPII